MDIKDSVIIVTGASERIGLATVKLLDELGSKVVLAARSAEKLKEVANKLTDALAVPTDMRNPEAIQNLVDAATAKYSRIDALVNNAGKGMAGPVESIDIAKYQQVIELNVYGTLRAMQAVIPVMRKQGSGTILNISSNVSKNLFPNLSSYASTKYALNCLSLTARSELEKDGIIVGVMHPGLTATNFGVNDLRNEDTPKFDMSGRQADTTKEVAEKIIKALQTGAAETAMRQLLPE